MANCKHCKLHFRPFLVLLLPGLTSSSQTSYVRTLVQSLNKIGASVLVFNNRGNGGVPFKVHNLTGLTYFYYICF